MAESHFLLGGRVPHSPSGSPTVVRSGQFCSQAIESFAGSKKNPHALPQNFPQLLFVRR
jgi:hypothetical protein